MINCLVSDSKSPWGHAEICSVCRLSRLNRTIPHFTPISLFQWILQSLNRTGRKSQQFFAALVIYSVTWSFNPNLNSVKRRPIFQNWNLKQGVNSLKNLFRRVFRRLFRIYYKIIYNLGVLYVYSATRFLQRDLYQFFRQRNFVFFAALVNVLVYHHHIFF